MTDASVARFYDQLADDYHLIYADWGASAGRQGAVLHALLGRERADVLDCSCGIGTQAIGLALQGHRVTGTDLSARAVARAAREAARRGLTLPVAVADMRGLPFLDGRSDAVVCADNALPHLLTAADVRAALAEMCRVLRPGGRGGSANTREAALRRRAARRREALGQPRRTRAADALA